jgi:hypothetical protein
VPQTRPLTAPFCRSRSIVIEWNATVPASRRWRQGRFPTKMSPDRRSAPTRRSNTHWTLIGPGGLPLGRDSLASMSLLSRIAPWVRARPERTFRIHLGPAPFATASLVLYRERSGRHHWEWSFDRFKSNSAASVERSNRIAEMAVTTAEKRLGLSPTYPPDHWTHRSAPPDWVTGWPWDASASAKSAEEAAKEYP